MALSQSFIDKFIEDPSSGCWVWSAGLKGHGYAAYWEAGKQWRGHRYSYEKERGPIPKGLSAHHLCDNRKCVNPWHIELVTHADNCSRKMPKTHCPRGHEYTPENTLDRGKLGKHCRQCKRMWDKRRYHRRKAEILEKEL